MADRPQGLCSKEFIHLQVFMRSIIKILTNVFPHARILSFLGDPRSPSCLFPALLLFIFKFFKEYLCWKSHPAWVKGKVEQRWHYADVLRNLVETDSLGLSQKKTSASPSSQKWLQYEVVGINHTPSWCAVCLWEMNLTFQWSGYEWWQMPRGCPL